MVEGRYRGADVSSDSKAFRIKLLRRILRHNAGLQFWPFLNKKVEDKETIHRQERSGREQPHKIMNLKKFLLPIMVMASAISLSGAPLEA